jgi:hypothetical protein
MPLSGHFVVTSPGHPALIDPLQLGKMGHTKGHITVATDSNRRFFSARPCAHVTIHDSSSSSRRAQTLSRARSAGGQGCRGVSPTAAPTPLLASSTTWAISIERDGGQPPPTGQPQPATCDALACGTGAGFGHTGHRTRLPHHGRLGQARLARAATRSLASPMTVPPWPSPAATLPPSSASTLVQ